MTVPANGMSGVRVSRQSPSDLTPGFLNVKATQESISTETTRSVPFGDRVSYPIQSTPNEVSIDTMDTGLTGGRETRP